MDQNVRHLPLDLQRYVLEFIPPWKKEGSHPIAKLFTESSFYGKNGIKVIFEHFLYYWLPHNGGYIAFIEKQYCRDCISGMSEMSKEQRINWKTNMRQLCKDHERFFPNMTTKLNYDSHQNRRPEIRNEFLDIREEYI